LFNRSGKTVFILLFAWCALNKNQPAIVCFFACYFFVAFDRERLGGLLPYWEKSIPSM